MKRFISFFLALLTCLSLLPLTAPAEELAPSTEIATAAEMAEAETPTAAEAPAGAEDTAVESEPPAIEAASAQNDGASVTRDQAIAWVQSQLEKTLGDGASYGECVGLIRNYYSYLGGALTSGNACDYSWNKLPAGWTRVQGGVPQKGDIIVFSAAGEYISGHIAIYESEYVTYYQNYNGRYVRKITNVRYNNAAGSPYWGCIRPNFTDAKVPVSVTFQPWDSAQNNTYIRDTDASIGQKFIVTGIGACGGNGMYLYDSAGNFLASGKNDTYYTGSDGNGIAYFQINAEMGYTLTPGTTYQYKYYLVVSGKTYWSDMRSFKTTGTAPTPTPTPTPTPSAGSSGWQQTGGNWYYMKNGKAVTGWLKSGDSWYYLDTAEATKGVMLRSAIKTLNGKKYLFNSSGVWVG